jgi:hypothetical protein
MDVDNTHTFTWTIRWTLSSSAGESRFTIYCQAAGFIMLQRFLLIAPPWTQSERSILLHLIRRMYDMS